MTAIAAIPAAYAGVGSEPAELGSSVPPEPIVGWVPVGVPRGMPLCWPWVDALDAGTCEPYCGACEGGAGVVGADGGGVFGGTPYDDPRGTPLCWPWLDSFDAGTCEPYCGACEGGAGIVGADVVTFAGALYGDPSGMPPCWP